jgi:hypothetical protein
MSKDIIRLKEVLEQMETATEPFSIRYVACNRKKNTGGRIVHLERCYKTGNQSDPAKLSATKAGQKATPTVASKNPHHYDNYTRNLKVVPSGKIRKCCIWLIIQFNGKKVII